MMQKTKYIDNKIIKKAIYLLIFLLSSCSTPKNLIYFSNAEIAEEQTITQRYDLKVQKDDLLSITITSLSPEVAVQPFVQEYADGYLVNSLGQIGMQIIGWVEVEGLTFQQVSEHIQKLLIDGGYLKDPKVLVRLMNFKITVLGEVIKPGVHEINSDRITIFEALALSGDMTIYGERDMVTIAREENGVRVINNIDITSKDIFSSQYYYLRPNDLIVVKPNKQRKKDSIRQQSLMMYVFPAIATILSIISIFKG